MNVKFLPLVVFLVGCSTLSTPPYNPVEHELIAKIETTTTLINQHCDDLMSVQTVTPSLTREAALFDIYVKNIPYNTEIANMSDIIRQDVLEFTNNLSSPTYSSTYCTLKTKLMLQKIHLITKAVVSKMRV